MNPAQVNHVLIAERFLRDGEVEVAIHNAVQSALKLHQRHGNPIPVYENGKVILIMLSDQSGAITNQPEQP